MQIHHDLSRKINADNALMLGSISVTASEHGGTLMGHHWNHGWNISVQERTVEVYRFYLYLL